MEEFHWVLIRGLVFIHDETQPIFDSEADILFALTEEMKPSVNLIVYFVHESGEIIHDELKIEFEESDQDYVS